MASVIIISPSSLVPQADLLATSLGLPSGQFSQDYDEEHRFCHFTPTPAFQEALGQPLPLWVQVLDCDAEPVAWDESKVAVFVSDSQDGWVFKATVDVWPRV